jgi:putative transposase
MDRETRTKYFYTVRRLKIGRTEQMDALARAAGDLYSQVVIWFWRTVRHKDLWLKARHLMRWLTSALLHAHSSDAVVQCFFAALASWRERRKEDPDAKPPHKRKWFYRVIWKPSAISVRDGTLHLANGRGNAPLVVPWLYGLPCQVEMGWDGQQYELRATYRLAAPTLVAAGEVAGIDLGEVHLAASHDGTHTIILNGGHMRSLRRYQNKLKAKLQKKIDRKRKGSKRRKRLIRSKKRQLRSLRQQIRDALHKLTTRLVSTLYEQEVQTVAIGDLRNNRIGTDYGHMGNQRIHQMPSGQARQMLTYKAERLGMVVVLQDEHYTTQSCPRCGRRHKPKGRLYQCGKRRGCGFTFHRDGVGAINIRHKYTNSGSVVGAMASPIGVRYSAHMRCSTLSERAA